MNQTSTQQRQWSSKFGDDYIGRNYFDVQELDEVFKNLHGTSRTEMYSEFFGDLPRSIKILEVGCNIGNQLLVLESLGFTNLTGIEINPAAIEEAKKRLSNANIVNASATEIPFEDGFFDLVFTSGVLIHINTPYLEKAVQEIYRVSNDYIAGYEYFSEERREVTYRGQQDLLWKENFMKRYLSNFPDLQILKERSYNYKDSNNVDQMFLLKKSK